tara:strand:+ start:7730 stop:9268 length:1539 start_codon:yes stop_codon:yes gene_type:complete
MAKEVLEMEVKSNIGEVTKDTNSLAKESNKASTGVAGIGTAFAYVGRAIKAAGIGLVVALLAKLMQVFSQNQKVLDVFNTAMTAMSIAFNDLFSYLDDNYEVITGYLKGLFTDPLGEMAKLGLGIEKFFIDKMKGAALVLKGVATIMANLSNPKKMLEGLAQISAGTVIAGKEIADIYADIEGAVSDYVTSVTDQAKGLTEVQKLARLAQITFAQLNAESLRAAELQRQIRDDVSKTFAERIAANEKLSEILKEQAVAQEAELQIQLDAATQALAINKDNIDLQIAAGEAEVAMAELRETISGQESEQLTNKIALEEELRVGREQSLAEGSSGLERELEELRLAYEEKKRLADKSGVDTVAITKQYEKQKSDLVKANMLVQLDAYANLAGALSTLAGENKALAVAEAIMSTYSGATKALAAGAGTPAGWINAAAIIAAGLGNVSKIMAVDVGGGGGGGGNVAAPSTPAPQMMSGAFELTGGVEPEPTRAYVVTDDMTNSQNQLANIRRRATI